MYTVIGHATDSYPRTKTLVVLSVIPIYRHKLPGFETIFQSVHDPKIKKKTGRSRDLTASALVSRSSGPGLSPVHCGHCVALSGETLAYHSASLPRCINE